MNTNPESVFSKSKSESKSEFESKFEFIIDEYGSCFTFGLVGFVNTVISS